MSKLMVKMKAALEAANLHFRELDPEHLSLSFGNMEKYRDIDGDPHVDIVMSTMGDRITLFAPRGYRVPDGANRPAVLETCMRMQWRHFGIRFLFDHSDGELRLALDLHARPCRIPTTYPG